MKWQPTIIVNILILFGFWLAGFVAISPAYNHFIQYSDINNINTLPVFTSFVFSVRFISFLIPVIWLFVSIILMMRFRQRSQLERIELVQLHTSLSIFGGIVLFLVFALAGILPYLKFGGLLE